MEIVGADGSVEIFTGDISLMKSMSDNSQVEKPFFNLRINVVRCKIGEKLGLGMRIELGLISESELGGTGVQLGLTVVKLGLIEVKLGIIEIKLGPY